MSIKSINGCDTDTRRDNLLQFVNNNAPGPLRRHSRLSLSNDDEMIRIPRMVTSASCTSLQTKGHVNLENRNEPEEDSLNTHIQRHASIGIASIAPRHSVISTQGGPSKRPNDRRRMTAIELIRKQSRATKEPDHNPFHQLWVLLSSLYGIMLLILTIAFSLTEVMDNNVKLFSLQGAYLAYLYVGSIIVIICIYIWVLMDSFSNKSEIDECANDQGQLTAFGSLKRAHISRRRTSNTGFYIRIGALVFGIATLVFSGLEIAMHSMMDSSCVDDVIFAHPILHSLFTFLQMHFLFVNSQVLVEKFGFISRLGFVHLAATNIALWLRLVVWDTGLEWLYFVFIIQSGPPLETAKELPTPLQLRGFPRFLSQYDPIESDGYNTTNVLQSPNPGFTYRIVSEGHMKQVVALHLCINGNAIGQLWTSSVPFLYPFIVQFGLIAAAVAYVMGEKVGIDKLSKKKEDICHLRESKRMKRCSVSNNNNNNNNNNSNNNYRMEYGSGDCSNITKGLFFGLLSVVCVIIVIIIFVVLKEDSDFPHFTAFWITHTTLLLILLTSLIASIIGLIQLRKLPHIGSHITKLDSLLRSVCTLGVLIYTVFSALVGANGLINHNQNNNATEYNTHVMLLIVNVVQIIQTCLQTILIGEALQRGCITRLQFAQKPARQTITYLLCSNGALWTYECFVSQCWISQEMQLKFTGLLLWGVISRLSLPLLVFYRFHSVILLIEIWNQSYIHNSHLDFI